MEYTYNKYVDDVLNGKVTVCKYTRLAVERHHNNLQRQDTDGFRYYFDEDEAQRWIDFAHICRLYKGKRAPNRIVLQPHQQFYFADLFGWKRMDGTRKYRTSNRWVGRKNGKTTEAAIIGKGGLVIDGENAPQIYSIATKGEQAAICWEDAKKIAKKTPELQSRLEFYAYSIVNNSNNGFFKYLASDSKSMDGFDPHFVIADEVHAHRDSRMMDVMKSGMGARTQPLMLEISTSGFELGGIGKEHWDYTIKVLEGVAKNESWHGIIYTLDEEDDWKDPDVWEKANPNLGVSKSLDYMKDEFNEAKSIPSKEIDFKTKHLNVWVSSKTGFVPSEQFKKGGKKEVTLAMLAERECIATLDLGEVVDLTAFAILGLPRHSGDDYLAKVWRWIPRDTLQGRKNADTLMGFIRNGFIRATGGNATDFDVVEDDIIEIVESGLDITEIIFDPNKGQQIPQHLAEYGIEPIAMAQTYRNLNPGVDEMERVLLDERFNYGTDEMLPWSNSNIVIRTNSDGYRKFDKKEAQDKIDDMVALEMGFAHAASKEEDKLEQWDSDFVAI